MTRRPANVTQTDIARAIRAAKQAGVHVARVEIDKAGKIIIVTKDADNGASTVVGGENEWDRV